MHGALAKRSAKRDFPISMKCYTNESEEIWRFGFTQGFWFSQVCHINIGWRF